MLKLSRANLDLFNGIQKKLVETLKENPLIQNRVNQEFQR
jgi:hypothetical protein